MNRKDRRLAARSERSKDVHHEHHRLAEQLRRAGDLVAAERHYRRAAELSPSAETRLNLGTVLLELQRPADAQEAYQSALALDPGQPAAHYGVGCTLRAAGDPTEAAAAFARAIALAPAFRQAHEALIEALLSVGAVETACRAACHALLRVDSPALRAAFVSTVTQGPPPADTPGLRQAMRRALTERWRRPPELARAAALIAGQSAIDPSDTLLRTVLETAPVCDAAVEAALTAERRRLLEAAPDLSPNDLAIAASLARQGWINEFAWFVTPGEGDRLAALRQQLQNALDRGEALFTLAVVVGMYLPLAALANAAVLLSHRPPASLASIFAQQIAEPAEEARLRALIPSMPDPGDATTQKVREQYEENPYPRWLALPAVNKRGAYADFLAARFPAAPKRPSRPLDVLIAGCGTGQHPLELRDAFTDLKILAIDLSLTSLAYAARMSAALGFTDIEYRQVNLLRIAELGRDFDIIESSGVLHHMADLWAGWRALLAVLRPGGVMAVSLYSKRARADVEQARAWIAAQGFPSTPDGIRACRQAFMALPDPWARNLAASSDFASLSGCRDLLFHVHESAVSLPEIADFLAAEKLEFLGIDTPPDVARAYKSWAASESLGLWDQFEAEHPGCFATMIHLWVRKA